VDGPDREVVTEYLAWLDEAPPAGVGRARVRTPVAALQAAAVADADPRIRTRCLEVLDHLANDVSTATFATALSDPVTAVRAQALHGLTCERCRTEDVGVVDVVTLVVAAFEGEPDPDLRHRYVDVLARFAAGDATAGATLRTIALDDPDELVRTAALHALTVGHVRSRPALRRRARTARRRR
jgi:HEAT repeat protein